MSWSPVKFTVHILGSYSTNLPSTQPLGKPTRERGRHHRLPPPWREGRSSLRGLGPVRPMAQQIIEGACWQRVDELSLNLQTSSNKKRGYMMQPSSANIFSQQPSKKIQVLKIYLVDTCSATVSPFLFCNVWANPFDPVIRVSISNGTCWWPSLNGSVLLQFSRPSFSTGCGRGERTLEWWSALFFWVHAMSAHQHGTRTASMFDCGKQAKVPLGSKNPSQTKKPGKTRFSPACQWTCCQITMWLW